MNKTASSQLNVGGYVIDVTRKNVRRINLSLYGPAASIRVSAPRHCPDAEITDFVRSKLAWLDRHIKLYQLQQRFSAPEYVQGETIFLQGRRYTLNVLENASLNRIVAQEDGRIELYLKPGTSPAKRQLLMQNWYRALLEARMALLILTWQERLGVQASAWGIKRMKTRWGSCSIAAKRIWINLELARRSDFCLEYIIVHELLHLLERGHGPAFHALMDRYLPDWHERERELKLLPETL